METVDVLLTNALVLTMDEKYNLYEPGAIAIQGDSIVGVGPEAEIRQRFTSNQIMDCGGKVVMPGMVNAHTHVPMTLLRGLADDLRLDVWLMGYMLPVEREFVSPDFVRLGTRLACAEMLRSGVTSFADMYYFEDDIAFATAEAGMRAVCSQSVMKFPTPDAPFYEESLAASRDFIQRWKNHPLVVPSVAPHAAYSCTPEILAACSALAVEFDVPLHTHISETGLEVENMRAEQGMPVVPYMKKHSILEAKVLAAHCVHIDEGEIRTLQHAGAGVGHCPSSNLKLASGIAPIKRMLELGLNVGIGTDGPASNNDLDMFEEVRLAAFLAKGSSGDPTALPARTALAMATRLGANALHIGNLTGSLTTGKRADLILVDINPLHNSPRFRRDPHGAYAQLVYASKATDVTDVMVNGQWLMRDRKLLTIDEAEILRAAEEYAHKIDIFLMRRETSVLSKLIAIGGTMESESFEVQVKIQLKETEPVLEALKSDQIEIIRARHYRQFDTYFTFEDAGQGYLRYREDQFINETGETTSVRSRLTLIGLVREHRFPQRVLLSRSRYLAPANQSLRFYREYFKPRHEIEVEKDRLRYSIRYKDTDFYVNVDTVSTPELGCFVEIKSNTWSLKDAENKSTLVRELIALLGADPAQSVTEDYFDLARFG